MTKFSRYLIQNLIAQEVIKHKVFDVIKVYLKYLHFPKGSTDTAVILKDKLLKAKFTELFNISNQSFISNLRKLDATGLNSMKKYHSFEWYFNNSYVWWTMYYAPSSLLTYVFQSSKKPKGNEQSPILQSSSFFLD